MLTLSCGLPWGSDGKDSACSAEDLGSIPGLGRSPAEGDGYPLLFSGLENSMDRGAWWATTHEVAESDMTECLSLSLSLSHTHTHTHTKHMSDLVPRPGTEPMAPGLGVQSLSYWTIREVP